MTFICVLLTGFALAASLTEGRAVGAAAHQAEIAKLAKMAPAERERWLLELEARLDRAARQTMSPAEAAEERMRIYTLLRQPTVTFKDLANLLRLADAREQAAKLAARPDPSEILKQAITPSDPRPSLPGPTPSSAGDAKRGSTSLELAKRGRPSAIGTFGGTTLPESKLPSRTHRTVRVPQSAGGIWTTPGRATAAATVGVERPTIDTEELAATRITPPSLDSALSTNVGNERTGSGALPRPPREPSTFNNGAGHPQVAVSDAMQRPEVIPRPDFARPTPSAEAMARTTLKPMLPADDNGNVTPAPRPEEPRGTPKFEMASLPPEPPAMPPRTESVKINIDELSSRVVGTNMALRELESRLDERNDWSTDELGRLVARLQRLMTRRQDLTLYMEIVSSKERILAGRLESPRTVISQLSRQLDAARAHAAGPDFIGSAADRQVELQLLDEMLRVVKQY